MLETCTGRIRYLGVLLYDADKVLDAASTPDEKDLYKAQCDLFMNPHDPEVIAQARKDGISEDWLEAAQNSPVYKLAIEHKLAFPLHPEYRTLPMVWYVPPLNPIMNYFEGKDSLKNPDMIFPGYRRDAHTDPVSGEHADRRRYGDRQRSPAADGHDAFLHAR